MCVAGTLIAGKFGKKVTYVSGGTAGFGYLVSGSVSTGFAVSSSGRFGIYNSGNVGASVPISGMSAFVRLENGIYNTDDIESIGGKAKTNGASASYPICGIPTSIGVTYSKSVGSQTEVKGFSASLGVGTPGTEVNSGVDFTEARTLF